MLDFIKKQVFEIEYGMIQMQIECKMHEKNDLVEQQ
jgi:hypothetical protein